MFGGIGFNPRARAGRDYASECIAYKTAVSIHAPARGATSVSQQKLDTLMFQSTRPRGARPNLFVTVPENRLFQSTRPRGARQSFSNQGKIMLFPT